MVQKLVLMTLLVCAPVVLTVVNAGDVPVIHKFEFWGKMSPYEFLQVSRGLRPGVGVVLLLLLGSGRW